VPVVSLTYDGTGGQVNETVIPYLRFSRVNRAEDKSKIGT
jgi:hypothetical protein